MPACGDSAPPRCARDFEHIAWLPECTMFSRCLTCASGHADGDLSTRVRPLSPIRLKPDHSRLQDAICGLARGTGDGSVLGYPTMIGATASSKHDERCREPAVRVRISPPFCSADREEGRPIRTGGAAFTFSGGLPMPHPAHSKQRPCRLGTQSSYAGRWFRGRRACASLHLPPSRSPGASGDSSRFVRRIAQACGSRW